VCEDSGGWVDVWRRFYDAEAIRKLPTIFVPWLMKMSRLQAHRRDVPCASDAVQDCYAYVVMRAARMLQQQARPHELDVYKAVNLHSHYRNQALNPACDHGCHIAVALQSHENEAVTTSTAHNDIILAWA
jgi:hypothetical protein